MGGFDTVSLTIHDLDPRLSQRLTARARREGVSESQLVKRILALALGMERSGNQNDEYREFLGRWSREDLAEFQRRQSENARVGREDWR